MPVTRHTFLTNATMEEADDLLRKTTMPLIVGKPKATQELTVEELSEAMIVGIYQLPKTAGQR